MPKHEPFSMTAHVASWHVTFYLYPSGSVSVAAFNGATRQSLQTPKDVDRLLGVLPQGLWPQFAAGQVDSWRAVCDEQQGLPY